MLFSSKYQYFSLLVDQKREKQQRQCEYSVNGYNFNDIFYRMLATINNKFLTPFLIYNHFQYQITMNLPNFEPINQMQLLQNVEDEPKVDDREKILQQRLIQAARRDQSNGIASSWRDLCKLQELRLSFTGLVELPQKLCQLTELKMLYLSGNLLKFLPQNIGALRELTLLRLENNQLAELPVSLGNLTKLQYLVIDNNEELQQLPKSLSNLKSLTGLSIDLRLVPESNIFQAKPFSSFSNLNDFRVCTNCSILVYQNASNQRLQILKHECQQRKMGKLWINDTPQKL